MITPEVTLYDLASKGKNACWSLNPWKTRLLLNYKQIPYQTEFMEYPDLNPFFKSVNALPSDGSNATIPTIKLSTTGQYIMDSRAIASALEDRYPNHPLRLDAPELKEIEELFEKAFEPLRPVVVPRHTRELLNERSVEYFERTRKEALGMSLEEFERSQGGDVAFRDAEEPLGKLADVVRRHAEGPFVLGKEVSYADFIIASAFEFAKRTGQDIFERLSSMQPALADVHKACAPWLERDDH